MRIRLIRERQAERESRLPEQTTAAEAGHAETASATKRVSHRQFLKGIAGALGVIGAASLAAPQRTALATDDNVTIQGALVVTDRIGIGTTTPETSLHLSSSGSVKIGSRVIADANGCYYA